MRGRNRILCGLLVLCSGATVASAQRITREEYILKYKGIAIEQMERFGIPASVKMAQALLESDNGNSRLAKEANNHFGIKCKGDWKGEVVEHDDDAAGECFRKYGSVEESFEDHSRFLDDSPRYNDLFDLKPTDYRGWAYGLKRAGYATNPKYPELLIGIIEENKLYLLDEGVDVTYNDIRREQRAVDLGGTNARPVNVDDYTVTMDRAGGRPVRYNNGVPYVLAGPGDTFESIARDLRMSVSCLLKFNDLASPVGLQEGQALYTRKKNKRSENGYLLYEVKANDTMHSISQRFGIRLKNLYRINNMSGSDTIREGQQIRLR